MSPNGRRAWRKWVRRVEHNPKLRPPGKSISRLAREGKRHLGSIPPTPPKPFTARSIVGMTMGARKRAHRAAMVGLDYEDGVRFTLTTSTKYRIGQKLRPCLGCCACGVNDPGNEYPIPLCDGSGVLPARKSK